MKKKTIIAVIVVVAFIAIIINQISGTRNLSEIKGGFERVAFARNENNLEKILKIYAVSVEDLSSADYKAYSEALPHNGKSGESIIYFFDKNKKYPISLNLSEPHFDTTIYSPTAIYKKQTDGQGQLIRK